MKAASAIYTEAFRLAVGGRSVMPLQKDKRPLLKSWKTYQTERATPEQVEAWFKRWPDANLGLITGEISGITVIDVDSYKGGDISKFPETYTVRTGNGGYHLYYKYQPGLTISANAYPQFPGVDIRSDGGYVVAPPSVTDYAGKGGPYTVEKKMKLAPFPADLFPAHKERRLMSDLVEVGSGKRNDSITSFIGKLLAASQEDEWLTDVWPAVEHANKTYQPPLDAKELRSTFNSIVKKEQSRRKHMVMSPIQLSDGEKIEVAIRRNSNGVAYKDMANVLAVLSGHPLYKGSLRYNEFRQEIEYHGKPIEEADLVKIQYFMQLDAKLHGVSKEAVYAAIQHYANQNKYDEAIDWIKGLVWDGKPRLATWLTTTTGVEDSPYHEGVGAQWLTGLVRRIVEPGSIFDYVLVLVGAQGIGKTSFFRIIGGPWYKSYTGAIDNKDFYLALRGAAIVDLDEGAALYRSEAIKIKSIITQTHDEYRAPYDRIMKKYPRRFVFSMSTNDTEPFRDVTGNRRYWTVDAQQTIDFKWLEENRDQLFAEAYNAYVNKLPVPEVPISDALETQEAHLAEDSWTDLVRNEVCKSLDYCMGKDTYSTTISEIYSGLFSADKLNQLGRAQEMRIATILRKEMGLESRRQMLEGERKNRWMISPKKLKQLQAKNARPSPDAAAQAIEF